MFNRLEKIDAQLPGIVIKDFVPLPNNEVRVDFNNDIDLKNIKKCNIIFDRTNSGDLLFESIMVD